MKIGINMMSMVIVFISKTTVVMKHGINHIYYKEGT